MDMAGGWAGDTICEDTDLGLAIIEHGWVTHYTNHRYGEGLLPDTYEAFKKQRHRWAYGGLQIVKKHWRRFFPGASRLSPDQRREFSLGWLNWLGAESLGVVVAILNIIWVPIVAFASGWAPEGGRDVRPRREAVAIDTAAQPAPVTGALDLPAGRYEVVPHKLTLISAQLKAGGDTFDAQFAEGITGEWRADPKDLTRPMSAAVSADAASVDTGIGGRSNHARDGFLHADKFPRIGWKLEKLVAARQDGPDKIAFRAAGSVQIMDKTTPVEAAGSLKKADAAALQRLGLTGAVLIAEAEFTLLIKDTALAPDAGSFNTDRFPIHVSLVLRHTDEK